MNSCQKQIYELAMGVRDTKQLLERHSNTDDKDMKQIIDTVNHLSQCLDNIPASILSEPPTLIVLERSNGWFGGYELIDGKYEQQFNTRDHSLFNSIKPFTDKGYIVKMLDKSQENDFMKNRTDLLEYLKNAQ